MISNQKTVGHSNMYGLLDYFRMVAAFMVVAIHTSPFLTISESANFIVTRIISRLAVPFFFSVSGFFLFKSVNNKEGFSRFIKKTLLLYIALILLFIPINVYMGYFKELSVLDIFKDLVFNGTMYHLWYLPAAILGAILSYFLINKIGLKMGLLLSLALYIVGLFGDSYYGILANNPSLLKIYDYNFLFFDYTRNGFYFAPIYFILGAYIQKEKKVSLRLNVLGFLVSFSAMMIEAMLLKSNGTMKHDSMYLFLVPSIYFLMHLLIQIKLKPRPSLRTISMIIYVIHPIMILIVRVTGKMLGLEDLFIHNSFIHFASVAVSSYLFAILITYIIGVKKRSKRKGELGKNGLSQVKDCDTGVESESHLNSRAWLEINLNHLGHNKEELERNLQEGCKLMAVVKANAYGHGAIKVANYLNTIGVDSFAVATIDEGIELRENGITGEILIFGYTMKERFYQLKQYNLIQTAIDYEYGRLLHLANLNLKVHIKIDTGMHRLGENVSEIEKISSLFKLENILICGIYTHLCVAESSSDRDVEYTNKQIEAFYELLSKLENMGIRLPKIHLQSSYGVLNYPNIKGDYARVGIALYGTISSHLDDMKQKLDLKPVLSLKARVALIRDLSIGESLGYGLTYTASSNRRIAVIPIGYADGLPRNLSGTGSYCLLHGRKAPIIGRICMDQLVIDVTEIDKAIDGDIVTIIGRDGDKEITALDLAAKSSTITNELFSRLGARLTRTYILE